MNGKASRRRPSDLGGGRLGIRGAYAGGMNRWHGLDTECPRIVQPGPRSRLRHVALLERVVERSANVVELMQLREPGLTPGSGS